MGRITETDKLPAIIFNGERFHIPKFRVLNLPYGQRSLLLIVGTRAITPGRSVDSIRIEGAIETTQGIRIKTLHMKNMTADRTQTTVIPSDDLIAFRALRNQAMG